MGFTLPLVSQMTQVLSRNPLHDNEFPIVRDVIFMHKRGALRNSPRWQTMYLPL
jgi:hypothetical protein